MDTEIGVTQQKIPDYRKNPTVIKIMSISYPLTETVCYIDENFHETLICEKSRNRKIFLTILRNLQFLSCQGLAFRGNNNEGNFEQLM